MSKVNLDEFRNYVKESYTYAGVSDNAVRKWCKYYGLPYRKKDIKEIYNL